MCIHIRCQPPARQSEQAMYAFVPPATREPIANYVVNIHIYLHKTICNETCLRQPKFIKTWIVEAWIVFKIRKVIIKLGFIIKSNEKIEIFFT